jgi:hypothetical protein
MGKLRADGQKPHRRPAGSVEVALHRGELNPPTTPDGEVEPRVVTMGSKSVFRSGPRSAPHLGLFRV